MLRIFTCLILKLACIISYSSAQHTDQEEYEIINTRNGLPHNIVLSIFQDAKGYMWFGTLNGLSKYDGNKFTNFLPKSDTNSIPASAVTCITENPRGIIWVGTRTNSYASFDKKSQTWTRYPYRAGSNFNNIYHIYNDRSGNTWILTDAGLIRLKQNGNGNVTAKTILTMSFPSNGSLAEDNAGRILYPWTVNICRLNENSTPEILLTNVSLSAGDNRGNLYVIRNGHIGYLNTGTRELTSFNDSLLSNKDLVTLFVNKAGHLFAADKEKMIVFNSRGSILKTYDLEKHQKVKGYDKLNCIYEDRSGVIWLGTDIGIIRILPAKFPFKKLSRNNFAGFALSHNYVRSLYADKKGDVWVGFKNGIINRITPSQKPAVRTYTCKTDPLITINSIIQIPRGDMLFGGLSGLFTLKNELLQKVSSKPTAIWCMEYDTLGYLWLGSKEGLFLKDLNTGALYHALQNCAVWTIYKDSRKQMWLGTNAGLFLATGRKTATTLKFRQYNKGEDGSALLGKEVWSIVEDENHNLWIGTTDGGLSCLDPGKQVFTNYSEKDGLTGLAVSGILRDAKNNLWISTMTGLSRFSTTDHSFWNFKEDDGLINNDFNFKACTKTLSGEMYFGTKTGISFFDPAAIHTNMPDEPPVLISAVKAFDRQLYTEPDNGTTIGLKYTDNFFSIEFALPDYLNAKRHRFRYMLEGFDKKWRYTDPLAPAAHYTNVPHGLHRFIAEGSADGNRWIPQGSVLYIDIKPAVWQTAWFRLAIIIIIACIIAGIIFIRTRRLINREKEKNSINRKMAELELRALQAQMNPHFIFNAISAIQHFFINKDERSANHYLSTFAALMRLYLESSKQKYMMLDEETRLLELYIGLEKLRFDEKFSYSIRIDDAVDPAAVEIPTMLIQPFVENAINHGLVMLNRPGHLALSFEMKNDKLLCIVDDNGIGRKKSAEIKQGAIYSHRSRGMEIVNERLLTFNQLEETKIGFLITDKTDDEGNPSGTRVEITIPQNN